MKPKPLKKSKKPALIIPGKSVRKASKESKNNAISAKVVRTKKAILKPENTANTNSVTNKTVEKESRNELGEDRHEFMFRRIREKLFIIRAQIEKEMPPEYTARLLKLLATGLVRSLQHIGIHPGRIESPKEVCSILSEPHRYFELMRKRDSKNSEQDDPHIYKKACLRAMLDVYVSHTLDRGEITLGGIRMLPEEKTFGDPQHRKEWWVWMRNYLVNLEKTGKLELPIGTKYAQSGNPSQRLLLRKKYFDELYDASPQHLTYLLDEACVVTRGKMPRNSAVLNPFHDIMH